MFKRGLVQIQLQKTYQPPQRGLKTGAGFSLLETLIATGVLIVVIMGVMALSNSLIAGTVVSADKTIVNRWATEGVELTQKIRDDTILDKSTAPKWFEQAIKENGRDYGWYKLEKVNDSKWQLTQASSPNHLTTADFINDAGSSLSSDQTFGYRLICIEAVSAKDTRSDEEFYCNRTDGQAIQDGTRSDPTATDCQIGSAGQPNDLYCQMTFESINRNRLQNPLNDKIIPSGNAVKIRSVVVWQDKENYRSSSMATLITNWKGYEQ